MLGICSRFLLSLRYRLSVKGVDELKGKRGVLVIPNHPAEVDPIIVSVLLWNTLRTRPVVLEFFYNLPLVNSFMRWIRAIPMPDMSFESGPFKRRRVEHALDSVVDALKKGDNILLYPSGRLSLNGEEKLGAASAVKTILDMYPDVPIVTIRTRGLFGSIFSKALTGGIAPDLFSALKRGAWTLMKNALFFTPRRPVSVEAVYNPGELPRSGTALQVNRFLENWYNTPTPEKASFYSFSAWRNELPAYEEKAGRESDIEDVPENIIKKVKDHVAELAQVSAETLNPHTDLSSDLGLDSLTLAELLLWLDQEFEASDIDLGELTTVGSIILAANGTLPGQTRQKTFTVPESWSRLNPSLAPGVSESARTVQAAFLDAAKRLQKNPLVADERSGVLSASRFFIGTLLLSKNIRKIHGEYIGLLFPASVGGSISLIATMLAKKTPVLINWTAGKRSIEHALSVTKAEKVLTSRAFLDLVQTDLEFMEDKFLFLEDILKETSFFQKIFAKVLSLLPTSFLLMYLDLNTVSSEDPAVVLFTSGSESLPKGVPLSHENILSNIKGALNIFKFTQDDVLLGFLPPFHSFGLTICTLLPLTSGFRVAFHANPNESRRIAKAVADFRCTLAAGTPTFLRSVLRAGEPEQYRSLRVLVSGAEKAPDDLFKLAEQIAPQVEILEGYGITECSPVVSVNRPGEKRVGVGKPLPGVDIMIVHPETHESVQPGEQGLILVKGGNVFSKYLDSQQNPFLNISGSEWYNTGDLGIFQNDTLTITGRLKRFIKIGGEMVSLSAVESALAKSLPQNDDMPGIAVLARGTEGAERPELVVFVKGKLEVSEANSILHENGFPHLVRISEIKALKEIPMLGSGKTDYQVLKGML